MPTLNIVTYPDKFLRHTVQPVKDIDEIIQKMIEDMIYTMQESNGVGLAAIQVGFDKSLIIYDISLGKKKGSVQILINPKIIESNGRIISENEGCLSVPDLKADVKRANSILVEGFDRKGKAIKIDAEGYHAIVLQHEIDHLNGILFIDHISALKRELYKRRIKKRLRKQ